MVRTRACVTSDIANNSYLGWICKQTIRTVNGEMTMAKDISSTVENPARNDCNDLIVHSKVNCLICLTHVHHVVLVHILLSKYWHH
jgi:hypothetical protein